MSVTIGFDTSNYSTSAALYDPSENRPQLCGRFLYVESGERGLRQRDAVFAHVRQMPEVISRLVGETGCSPAAVGVSVRPRDAEGSYMPCFLVGEAVAAAVAAVCGIPIFRCAHQTNHILAAAAGAQCLPILRKPFLAWHLSGGTTELLLVEPEHTQVVRCTRLGGTLDLAAGQVIDRTGVMLGLGFPCGKELDKLAESAVNTLLPMRPSLRDMDMNLSGIENRANALYHGGYSAPDTARFVLASVADAVKAATQRAVDTYPGLPLLCTGGVSCNTLLRRVLRSEFQAVFAPPELAADNAAGCAVYAAMQQGSVSF